MIIYNFIKYLIFYIRYTIALKKAYREEHIVEGLSKVLGFEIQEGWVGQLYGLLNPFIGEDGLFDPAKAVYEYGSDTPSIANIENVIMGKLNVIQNYLRSTNLFDLLTYKIEPYNDNYDFAVEFWPAPYEDLKKWTKRLIILLFLLALAGAILLIVF